MNSTSDLNGVNGGAMENTTNTTFQILAKSGHKVGPEYGGVPNEVAFTSATKIPCEKQIPRPAKPGPHDHSANRAIAERGYAEKNRTIHVLQRRRGRTNGPDHDPRKTSPPPMRHSKSSPSLSDPTAAHHPARPGMGTEILHRFPGRNRIRRLDPRPGH